jgi:hypothetical protein
MEHGNLWWRFELAGLRVQCRLRLQEHHLQRMLFQYSGATCKVSTKARLARVAMITPSRYTGNDTYAVWAEKAWNWIEAVNLINETTWAVYDGHETKTNCSETRQGLDDKRWTYNHG